MANFPPTTHLVTADCVRALRGITGDAVQCLVESGQLRWVWDVNARHAQQISERRFLLAELLGSVPANATLADVIRLILGQHRQAWRGTEVSQMLLVSRPAIHRLRKSKALPGKIANNVLWIQRPALERFFNIRYLGNPLWQTN